MTYDLSFTDRLLYSPGEHSVWTAVQITPPAGAQFEIEALLDTGASISHFDKSLLPQLGIADVTVGSPTLVRSVSQKGKPDTGYIHDIEVTILGHKLTLPVVFCPAWPEGATSVLGMEGFFDHWRFAFDHENRRVYYVAT